MAIAYTLWRMNLCRIDDRIAVVLGSTGQSQVTPLAFYLPCPHIHRTDRPKLTGRLQYHRAYLRQFQSLTTRYKVLLSLRIGWRSKACHPYGKGSYAKVFKQRALNASLDHPDMSVQEAVQAEQSASGSYCDPFEDAGIY